MSRGKRVHFRNESPDGWWIYGEVQQWFPRDPAELAKTKRFRVWESTRILKARNREAAYRKAIRLSNEGMPSETFGGEWRFVGLSFLLPIYDTLEDGAEVVWDDHHHISPARIQRMVKAKHELSVFDDRNRLK